MTTETTTTETAKAIKFHAVLATINMADVKRNNTLDRHCRRKELAAAARSLFKQLGIKGISVTAPNYSMATAVDIRLPKREDYVRDSSGRVDWDAEQERGEAAKANHKAYQIVAEILHTAFPSHRDRSDTQSDHFDFKWSIN